MKSGREGAVVMALLLTLVVQHVDPKAIIGESTTSVPTPTVSVSPNSGESDTDTAVSVSPSPAPLASSPEENSSSPPPDDGTDKNLVVVVVESKGNDSAPSGSSRNETNSNYIIEYKPQVFESPEDIKTQQEWGGNCTLAHWDKCKALETWFGNYEDPKDGEIKNYIIDCKLEPVVCLTNSWTVTRCNLLCMSRCNREITFKYDKYVSHSGECQAHSHG